MQPLPKGVTGFDSPDSGVPVKRFTAACHAAARQIMGQVHHVRDATEHVTPDFHEALVSWNDGADSIRVLCNAYHPIVAFASPAAHEGDTHLEFVDCPPLADLLDTSFTLLTQEEACAAITSGTTAGLAESELEQMSYWKPRRIGDLIFNYWD